MDVVYTANNVFKFAFSLRGMRARKVEQCDSGVEEGSSSIIVKFMTIVALNKLNATQKVSVGISIKVWQGGEGVRFQF